MNLTKDPIRPLIITIATPAGLAMMFNTLYNVTGTYFASTISTTAVAGMSMSFLLYLSVVGIGLGFGSALTALIGNSLGQRREFLAKIYAQKGVVFVLLFAISMGILGYLITPRLLVLLGANDEFLSEALEYIRVIFLASPFFLAIKGLNGVLVALGDTKTLRNWLFMGLFINALFCYVYVYIFDFGVGGIAFATASVQFLGTLYLSKKVRETGMIDFQNPAMFLPDWRIYSKILRQAVPACLNYLSMSLGGLILLKFISHYGTNAVAGYGIALRIEQIVALPTIGIAAAVLSIISRNFGAKEYERVIECYKCALKILLYFCLFACAFCVFCGTYIISLFDTNAEVLSAGQSYLLINSFAFFGYGVINISGSALQAIKKPTMAFVLNAMRLIVLQICIFSFVVYVLQGVLIDIWVGMFFNVYFTAGCFLIYMYFKLKKLLKKDSSGV